jgi:RNA polymerase sigma factor (sigma-70 family)
MKPEQEKKLIEKSKKNKECFGEIYREYVDDVYRYAFSIVNNQEIAEEVTSITFVRALEKLNGFEWRGTTIKTWLFSIARYVAYENLSDSEFSEIDFRENQELLSKAEGLNSKNSGDTIVQKDEIHELLKDLSVQTREIIVLKIWEEYKFREVADIVGKSEDAVKKQYYRGLKKLERMLKQKGYDRKALLAPAIVFSVGEIKELKNYKPATSFVNKLNKGLFNSDNLFKISNYKIMESLPNSVKYIAVVAITTAVVLGGVVGVNKYVLDDEDPKTNEVEERVEESEDNNTDETAEISEPAEEPGNDTRPVDDVEPPTEEEVNQISFNYTYESKEYELIFPDAGDYDYAVKDHSIYGDYLSITLDETASLEIYSDSEVPAEERGGGAYGETIEHIEGSIYRNLYLGTYQYVKEVSSNKCEVPNQDPCVNTHFHLEDNGALRGYISTPQRGAEPSADAVLLADELMKNYEIDLQ